MSSGRHLLPEQWKTISVGNGTRPEGNGIHLARPEGEQIHDGTFFYETWLHPNTERLAVASFFLAGITLHLLLGDLNDREKLGLRGRGYMFKHPDREFHLELEWPHAPNECVTLTRVGTTEESAQHARGWKPATDTVPPY